MRLIDADELLETINNQDNWLGQMELSQMANINIYSLINTIPTVERATGKWIRENEVYSKCSLCGFKYADYRILFDFCPHCGADMSKE